MIRRDKLPSFVQLMLLPSEQPLASYKGSVKGTTHKATENRRTIVLTTERLIYFNEGIFARRCMTLRTVR